MQRNFFLTDLMKTGNHQTYERFLDMHTLPDQTIEYTGEYYTLHNYDLDSYDRKFALIDRTNSFAINPKVHLVWRSPWENSEYRTELARRVELLHSQGFKFILATPWESVENIRQLGLYPKATGKEFIWSGDVSWFWWYMYDKHKDNKFKFSHDHFGSYFYKKYDFLYLNKQPREHRIKLYNKLLEENVLSNSLYTFLGLKSPVRLSKEHELPWVDANNYPMKGMDQDITEQPYIDTVCSIVSETNDNDTDVFMTEKIWKPIIAQQVFVVHGNHLYLQKLRELGFKTFGSYFNESYDLERDRDKKIDSIVSLCKHLKTVDWQDIYRQTIALRQHNYDTFFNKEKLSEQINKTLISFLEFFDSSQVSS
jgi:hypothetical protein|tara:strand:+ start:1295 stop:2395 length:1101 start_codon:yes stop_codon:yes gene_type:complete